MIVMLKTYFKMLYLTIKQVFDSAQAYPLIGITPTQKVKPAHHLLECL